MKPITIYSKENIPWNFLAPVKISESGNGKRFIGVLASRGLSANRNYYEMDVLESICEQAIGLPIYYGTELRVNPNTGNLTENMHKRTGRPVGQIVRSWIEGSKVWFEGLLNDSWTGKLTKGFGLSIGGHGFAQKLIDSAGNVINKLWHITLNHLQLLSPNTPRGMSEAEVKEVQESMWFDMGISEEEVAILVSVLKQKNMI